MTCDILICGAGVFAERILCDLAAAAVEPVRIVIAGRNAERIEWLRTAANTRATIFGKPARIDCRVLDLTSDNAVADCLSQLLPKVIVQAASAQPSSVLGASGNAWSRLIAETSYSVTALFQADLSIRVARAARNASPASFFINCCYPDVVNSILKALELPVSCGFGNVAILASIMSAHPRGQGRNVKVLAHYQTLTPWRTPADQRLGPAPRLWIDDDELVNVFDAFPDIKLTRAPVIEVSGAANVPMLLAMAAGRQWRGHAPGLHGLPGGYPIAFDGTSLDLDLPTGLSRQEAIEWNAAFEKADGLSVTDDGKLIFAGTLRERLRQLSPALADGFSIADFAMAHDELAQLRARLLDQP